MKRVLALPMLLLLADCSGLAPATTQATAFQNPQNGQIAPACGPMQGFKGAVDNAEHGCTQAWQANGWEPMDRSVGVLPQ